MPPLRPSAEQAGGSWARTRQGRRCELAFLTHARPTSASEPFFCVFACVCVLPLLPIVTCIDPHTHTFTATLYEAFQLSPAQHYIYSS